jgi:hypothetical protein
MTNLAYDTIWVGMCAHQPMSSFQSAKHHSQLATMILGNNLFGMASSPWERSLPSFYFHYFYLHFTASQYQQPVYDLTFTQLRPATATFTLCTTNS